MDYFDFEQAGVPPFDDLTNSCPTEPTYNGIEIFDQAAALHTEQKTPITQPFKLKLVNDCEVEVVHATENSHEFPMYLARSPCKLCARMGLDCYLASRGALITGCTACISLYRECSFTHAEMPKGYVSTFPGISEDQQVCHGPITERKKAMISMEESRGRKTGARFPRDAVKMLKQWLSEHSEHPYPNEREKDELKQLTGLKRSQISNWLANARRRGKVRSVSGPSSPMLGAIDIPSACKGDELAELDPMSRWKISPPEHEPASMTDIARAITSIPVPVRNNSQISLHNSRASSRRASSEEDSNFSMFQAPSASSFETRDSSNSDFSLASSRSHRSRASLASSQDRRRRRRAPLTQKAATAQATKARAARIFQCTFCTETFPAKYDWQRHEKSLHLALERWTCCPQGGSKINPSNGQPQCVFCAQMDPSTDHLESHNFMACQEKTLQERTFYRKDHLRQHLKLMHNSKFDSSMEAWKSATSEIRSACGFCPSRFTTWQQRADHLAAHFRNGADMSTWRGDWGLDPEVEKLVENAIPPYLIGQEKLTMNPYVARAAALQTSPSSDSVNEPGLSYSISTGGSSEDRAEPDQMTRDSNCWHRLEDELSRFISEQQALGTVPEDKTIQDHARQIVYGDPDPWDWTCADNQTWLDAFKYQHGIGPAPAAAEHRATTDVPLMAPYVVKGGLRNRRVQDASAPHGGGLPEQRSLPTSARDPSTSSKNTASSSLNHTGPHQLGAVAPYSSSPHPFLGSNGPAAPNVFDFTPTEAVEQGMDVDLDADDFSALDLEAFGDMTFEDDHVGTGGGDSAMAGSGPSAADLEAVLLGSPLDLRFGAGGMPLHHQQLSPADMDVFGDFGADRRLGTMQRYDGVSVGDAAGMTQEDLDQLTGYMAGFQKP